MDLKFNAEPALAFFHAGPQSLLGGNRVGEGEERAFVPARFVEAFEDQVKFVIQHGLEPRATDVAFGRAINRIADGHVVGGNRFGHRAGCFAHVKKPARDFLAGTDLGEGAVALRVQIDLQRFLAGV